MRLVIDIPKSDYELACKYPDVLIATYAHYIKNGIPLPKGHGKIGDLDAVMSEISTSVDEMTNIGIAVDGEYLWAKLNDAVDNAPVIIEADTTRDCKTCGHSNNGKCAYTEECHECMWVNKYIEADGGEE